MLNLKLRMSDSLSVRHPVLVGGGMTKFKSMAEEGDDLLLDGGVASPSSWDEDEWQW